MGAIHLVTQRRAGFRHLSAALIRLREEAFTGPDGIGQLRFHLGAIDLAKEVRIEVGDIEETLEPVVCAVVPVRLVAVDDPGSFPTFQGDFEMVAWNHERVEFALEGRYEPPGSLLGHLLDAAALHRVAEESLSTFFNEAVDRLYYEARCSSETIGVPYT